MRPDVAKAVADLTAIRKMRGLSIERVCELTEFARRTLQSYEAGDRIPSAIALSRWAEAFDSQIRIMPRE
jgi:transcriptional regulator with XRE-family HTH domain